RSASTHSCDSPRVNAASCKRVPNASVKSSICRSTCHSAASNLTATSRTASASFLKTISHHTRSWLSAHAARGRLGGRPHQDDLRRTGCVAQRQTVAHQLVGG